MNTSFKSFLVLPLLALAASLPVHAADEAPLPINPNILANPNTPVSMEEADRTALNDLQKAVGEPAPADPQAAADAYMKFFGDRPRISPSVGVDAASSLGKLYGGSLKNPDQAVKIYDWAFTKFSSYPPSIQLLMNKADLLAAQKRIPEAEKVYADHLGQILSSWPQCTNDPMDHYSRLLEEENKPEEVAHVLGKFLVAKPAFVDPGPPNWDWVYDRLTNALIKAGHPDQALQWAKLRFVAAGYNATSLDRASRLLAKVWVVADPTKAGLQGFATAQTDLNVHNPLADVKLPALDKTQFTDFMNVAQGGDLINLLLISGDLKGAMAQARPLIDNPNTVKEGVLQVARVLKARDLSLTGANTYIQYLKTGGGNDPVEDFNQHPPENLAAAG